MNGPLHGCLKYQIDLGYHFMIVAEAYLKFSTCLSTKFQLHLVPEGETEVWAICTAPLLGTRK